VTAIWRAESCFFSLLCLRAPCIHYSKRCGAISIGQDCQSKSIFNERHTEIEICRHQPCSRRGHAISSRRPRTPCPHEAFDALGRLIEILKNEKRHTVSREYLLNIAKSLHRDALAGMKPKIGTCLPFTRYEREEVVSLLLLLRLFLLDSSFC
jgi:hypothetical protein